MARILVADDDPAIAEFVRRVLSERGHQVAVAADGGEAARALDVGSYDLLLADIRMPVLDGIALALKTRNEHPATRIVLITGYAEEKARAQNLRALVAALVTKPLTRDELLDVVDDLLSPPEPPLPAA